MYIPKRYGEQKKETCPFCGKDARSFNRQQIAVCKDHTEELLQEMKCVCGRFLERKSGKYGVFFICSSCGTMNLRKVLELNTVAKTKGGSQIAESHTKGPLNQTISSQKPKEIIIRSDDPDWF